MKKDAEYIVRIDVLVKHVYVEDHWQVYTC